MLTHDTQRVCTDACVGKLAKKPKITHESTLNIKNICLQAKTANNNDIE